MNIIEPTSKNLNNPSTVKRYSASLRLWHWLNMIVISGSLITVLINSTITDKHAITDLVKVRIQETKGVDNDLSRSVAGALEDKVWDIHIYFGYCLAGLLFFRLILEFFQVADQKFIRRLKKASAQFKAIKKDRQEALHELTVKIIYAIFYCLLAIMVVTGLSLAFDDDFQVLKSIHRPVKNVHGFCMYLILAFIVVHLVGVFLAERKKDSKGIVSDMINGG
ncbi:cytochrome b [Mucilaginibacter frigoritolerans]|uniref:Cytochrome b n=1 Tax=Mucilaginibacter frigoritolerans TaxID=652788 RepID=A0A562U5R8_9SPHI|nr:cytochrome b/b6 domain-containing protein [Mucilaginibacter frigoritolerans]TWJ00667.1 cytochrome b [Mucilaginibacter frigoritolerans]